MSTAHNEADGLSMIVVMGVTGAGKSHFINQLAGSEIVKEGKDLQSCQYLQTQRHLSLFD